MDIAGEPPGALTDTLVGFVVWWYVLCVMFGWEVVYFGSLADGHCSIFYECGAYGDVAVFTVVPRANWRSSAIPSGYVVWRADVGQFSHGCADVTRVGRSVGSRGA